MAESQTHDNDSHGDNSFDAVQLSASIKTAGDALGFNVVKIAPAVSPQGFHPFVEWLDNGYHADMEWIDRRRDAYRHPDGVLPETRSVIVVALNYHNEEPDQRSARISRYAWGTEDYHSVMRRMLKSLTNVVRQATPNARTRAVVDTAPLLERDFARLAGIGWYGKNTMLISRDIGSWFFIGAILTTAVLDSDAPMNDTFCGSCTACLDACPTNAFPEAGVLDANRCISYLTIERRDKSIAAELRSGMENWIFGCDVCQEVCPWNRFAPSEAMPEFQLRDELRNLDVVDLLNLNEQQFQEQFQRTPLERTGRDAIVRNAAIVAGNQENASAIPALVQLSDDASEMVQDAARWALSRIPTNNSDK